MCLILTTLQQICNDLICMRLCIQSDYNYLSNGVGKNNSPEITNGELKTG